MAESCVSVFSVLKHKEIQRLYFEQSDFIELGQALTASYNPDFS